VALIFLPLAGWMFYSCYCDARLAAGTADQSPVNMTVQRVYDANAGGLTARKYRAAGRVAGNASPVEVLIYRKQFNSLKPGDGLEIVATGDPETPFMTCSRSEKALGAIYFDLAGMPFNDGMTFSAIGGLVAIGWVFFGKRITRWYGKSPEEIEAEVEEQTD